MLGPAPKLAAIVGDVKTHAGCAAGDRRFGELALAQLGFGGYLGFAQLGLGVQRGLEMLGAAVGVTGRSFGQVGAAGRTGERSIRGHGLILGGT